MSIYDRPADEQLQDLRVEMRLTRDAAQWLRDIVRGRVLDFPDEVDEALAVEVLNGLWGLDPAIRQYDQRRRALMGTIEAEAERQAAREAFLAKDEPVTEGRCEARVPDPRGWYPTRCTRLAKVRRPDHRGEGPLLLCNIHRKANNTARYRPR